MQFRLRFLVRRMPIAADRSLDFKYEQEHKLTVSLWRPTSEEQETGYMPDDALGQANCEQEPDADVRAMFESLTCGVLPVGSDLSAGLLGREYDSKGHILGNAVVPLRVMPTPFQEFATSVERALQDYAFRTARVLRWRSGVAGLHDPFSFRELSWSLDGATWYGMPHTLQIYASNTTYSPRTDFHILNDVISLVGDARTEPLGHELFHEAWEQMGTNPRSALVVGIAAAETGVKQCISALAPDARWLIENLQSPPVIRLLCHYLPTLKMLPARTINVPRPTKLLRKVIEDGDGLRNEIVHGKPAILRREELERILEGIRDILWILDFACGSTWALEYVTGETREDLKQQGY